MDREIITLRRLSPTTGEQDKDWRAVIFDPKPTQPRGSGAKENRSLSGKILLDQKKYAESYAALNQLAKLSPNYQDASSLLGRARTVLLQQHYNEGIRLYREEKLEGAIAEWRAVLQYDPNHEAAKKNIEQAERLLKGLQQRQQKK